MDSSSGFDTINLGMVHCIYRGVTCYNFLSLKTVLASANSIEPGEMPHYAAFHLSHHHLPKKSLAFRVKEAPSVLEKSTILTRSAI